MTRKVFYSFHYEEDNWRVSQIRNIGAIVGNRPATDNDWETVKKGGDTAIEKWIDDQMKGRDCTIVLVGENTARRKWINYEIEQSRNNHMGIVGIHIHGFKDFAGRTSQKGENPFDLIPLDNNKPLSSIVHCHDPVGYDSSQKYNWIKMHLFGIVGGCN